MRLSGFEGDTMGELAPPCQARCVVRHNDCLPLTLCAMIIVYNVNCF